MDIEQLLDILMDLRDFEPADSWGLTGAELDQILAPHLPKEYTATTVRATRQHLVDFLKGMRAITAGRRGRTVFYILKDNEVTP